MPLFTFLHKTLTPKTLKAHSTLDKLFAYVFRDNSSVKAYCVHCFKFVGRHGGKAAEHENKCKAGALTPLRIDAI